MILVIVPIYLGVLLIMVIAMWIGYTMVTTPAPEPLEDFDFDEEEVAEKKEE
jgi:predicted DNA-binding transcriptional regulator